MAAGLKRKARNHRSLSGGGEDLQRKAGTEAQLKSKSRKPQKGFRLLLKSGNVQL